MKTLVVTLVMVCMGAGAVGCKKDETNCRRAYTEMQQLRASLEASLGHSQSAQPSEREFIDRCMTQPEAAQRCSIMSYAMAHQAECAQYSPRRGGQPAQ